MCKRISNCFSVSTQQDTAVAGADYITLTNSPLTFTPGGETLKHVTVDITDDDFIEGTERFTASLSTASSFTRIGSINETIVRIIDNDGTKNKTYIGFIGTSWKALDSVTDLCSHVFFRTEFFCDDFLRKQL